MTKGDGYANMMWRTTTTMALIVLAAAVLVQHMAAQGQGGGLIGRAAGEPEDALVSSDRGRACVYNRRDFNGLWARNPQAYALPPCPECGDPGPWPSYGYHGTPPPRTPEGRTAIPL